MGWNKWSDQEDEVLFTEYKKLQEEKTTWKEISEVLDRSVKSCKSRLDRIKNDRLSTENTIKIVEPGESPTVNEVFVYMRDTPRTLEEICNKFDRSPAIIKQRLEEMKEEGYNLKDITDRTFVETVSSPRKAVELPSLANLEGETFSIAIASDTHHGSNKAQITAYRSFLEYAVKDIGVKHIINPGDRFTGVGGYRGHPVDMIPSLAKYTTRGELHLAVQTQIALSLEYTPSFEGVTFYELGGNHDYWTIIQTGIDAVKKYCSKRDDSVYLGYDTASIPLTDQVELKLWHPSGGVPYAKSYRLQKGQESLSTSELQEAIREERSPKVNVLIAGHLHISLFMPDMPILGVHPGCFEGRTNYLKRKGYYPSIGGTILTFKVGDNGKIKSTKFEFVPFREIKDDWKRYPTMERTPIDTEPDLSWMDNLYAYDPTHEKEPPEYVGSH